MNILITGATGFIGIHLTKELIKQGFFCRCLVRDIDKAREIFKDCENIDFAVGDITKPESLIGIEKDIDIVFHLAALGHVSAVSQEAFLKFFTINASGTENLIIQCEKGNVRKFFHFSSTAAMGLIPDKVVDEDTIPKPTTPYQKSKLEGEKKAMRYYYKNGFPIIIFRPCMVFGEGGYGEFYKFVKLIKRGIMPKIGFKKKLTPIVYVDDVIQACMKGISNAKIGETYFICGESSYPFDEIIDLIKLSLNSRKITFRIPYFIVICVSYLLLKFSELTNKTPIVTPTNIRSTYANRVFSIEKAKKDFDYRPLLDINNEIQRVLESYINSQT